MTPTPAFTPDPKLDLVLERVVDVPRERVWAAWTEPKHMKEWFAPKPWTTPEVEVDVRPGGIFRTVMRSPEGELHPSTGCILEVVPNERLVFTDALGPGYRPNEKPFFTCVLTLQSEGKGTRYRAVAIHRDEATREQHEKMGFHEGWSTVLDQLVEHMKGR